MRKNAIRSEEHAYQVVWYEHPLIFVEDQQTGAVHDFCVGADGALEDDPSRHDLGDARREAIAYLAATRKERNAALVE